MLKRDKLDHTIGNDLDHHCTIPFIQSPRYPSFGEQHAMQQTLPNVCNGDCELVIKPLPDIKEHLFWHSIQQHLQPGRSTARRSLGLRWALQLLLPAASLEVGVATASAASGDLVAKLQAKGPSHGQSGQ